MARVNRTCRDQWATPGCGGIVRGCDIDDDQDELLDPASNPNDTVARAKRQTHAFSIPPPFQGSRRAERAGRSPQWPPMGHRGWLGGDHAPPQLFWLNSRALYASDMTLAEPSKPGGCAITLPVAAAAKMRNYHARASIPTYFSLGGVLDVSDVRKMFRVLSGLEAAHRCHVIVRLTCRAPRLAKASRRPHCGRRHTNRADCRSGRNGQG